jgi:hypothetical protein
VQGIGIAEDQKLFICGGCRVVPERYMRADMHRNVLCSTVQISRDRIGIGANRVLREIVDPEAFCNGRAEIHPQIRGGAVILMIAGSSSGSGAMQMRSQIRP